MVVARTPISYKAVMITAAQIRAARALIGWSQSDLADHSGVSVMSVKNIERGANDPSYKSLSAIERAFEVAGVLFLEPHVNRDGGHGIRLR